VNENTRGNDLPDELWTALASLAAGEATEREEVALYESMSDPAERARLLEELARLSDAAQSLRGDWDPGLALRRIEERAAGRLARRGRSAHPRLPRAWRGRIGATASAPPWGVWAALLMVMLLGAGTWWRQGSLFSAQRTAERLVEMRTRRGEQARLQLPGGTRIVLGAESLVRYSQHFGERERTLYLEGEAYFEVLHDPNLPMQVITPSGVTQDIGTKFAVRALPGENRMQVAVSDGSVVMRNVSDSGATASGASVTHIALDAGDVGEIVEGRDVHVRRGVDLAPYLGWVEGRLVFEDVPLREALPQLGRWLDLDISVADSALLRRTIRGTFTDESADGVVQTLAVILGARVRRDGSRITLEKR
jgi:ferric-dicitrate binding protein FerR (iron transport regulator)